MRERDKLEGKELICKGREMTCYCGSGGAGVEVPLAEDEARGHAGQKTGGGRGGGGGAVGFKCTGGMLSSAAHTFLQKRRWKQGRSGPARQPERAASRWRGGRHSTR